MAQLLVDTTAASGNAALQARARRVIPGGTSRLHNFYRPHPIWAHHATGCRVTDEDGIERLDFLNNMTSLIHGHAHPAINAAVVAQLERGSAFSEPARAEVELAELLVDRVPSIEQIRFANSGTEAVMMALKLARAFTGRSRIAKFEGFYHGYYDYAQVSYASTSSNWGDAQAPASVPSSAGLSDSVLEDVVVLPFNDESDTEDLLASHAESLAAVIVDPACQRAGFPHAQPGFSTFLREVTRRYGILLVYDEVISFRVAYAGGQGLHGGEPDLTTLGKIIGGGLPIGAVGGRSDIMALLDPSEGPAKVASGGTFSANPLSMTAGATAMRLLDTEALDRLNALGDQLRTRGTRVFAELGEPGQVAGEGSLFRILLTNSVINNYRDLVRTQASAERIARLHKLLLEEGVIVGTNLLGCLSTPMTELEVDSFVEALRRAIQRLVVDG